MASTFPSFGVPFMACRTGGGSILARASYCCSVPLRPWASFSSELATRCLESCPHCCTDSTSRARAPRGGGSIKHATHVPSVRHTLDPPRAPIHLRKTKRASHLRRNSIQHDITSIEQAEARHTALILSCACGSTLKNKIKTGLRAQQCWWRCATARMP